MPGIGQDQITQMPAMTPSLYLDRTVEDAFVQLQNTEQQLRGQGLPAEQFNAEFGKYQQEFDKLAQTATETQQQFQKWQQLADMGMIDAQRVQQAMWKMILPADIAKGMVPQAEDQGTPYSPGQLVGSGKQYGSGGFMPSISEFAEAAEGFNTWGGAYKPGDQKIRHKTELVKQYKAWRDFVGYDSLDPVKQRQLDIQWDDTMAADKRFRNWKPDDRQIKSLRAKGPLTKAMAQRITGSPTNAAAVRTPLQTSIEKAKPKAQQNGRVTVTMKDGTIATLPADQVEAARKAGYIK